MKGSVLDLIGIVVILFIFAIGTFIGSIVLTEYQEVAEPFLNNTESTQIINTGQATLSYFDSLAVFIVFGLMIGVIVGGYYLKVHPALMGVSIIVLGIIILVTANFSNIFYEFIQDETLGATAANYPYINLLFTNLPTLILLFGVIVIVVIYGFRQRDGSGGGFS